MKPLQQWNAPLGLVHVLVLGCLLIGCMSVWIGYMIPHLLSLLASQRRFAEQYPFLYDLASTAVVFTLLPLMGIVPFVVAYIFQRSYDRERQRHTAGST